MYDIVGFVKQSMRVMSVASRPRQKDFEKIVKITGIGAALIGLAGVIISYIFNLV